MLKYCRQGDTTCFSCDKLGRCHLLNDTYFENNICPFKKSVETMRKELHKNASDIKYSYGKYSDMMRIVFDEYVWKKIFLGGDNE